MEGKGGTDLHPVIKRKRVSFRKGRRSRRPEKRWQDSVLYDRGEGGRGGGDGLALPHAREGFGDRNKVIEAEKRIRNRQEEEERTFMTLFSYFQADSGGES